MNWELAKRAVISLPKVIFYKIRYGKRISTGFIHAIGKHSDFFIGKQGKLQIGQELVARDNFHARVESGKIVIGDKCFFNYHCSVTCMEGIEIGAGSQIGNNVVIVDHNHTPDFTGYTTAPVIIGKQVWIGANCVILSGSKIGDGAVIGAGSVVTGEIPAGMIYYNKREKVMVKKK